MLKTITTKTKRVIIICNLCGEDDYWGMDGCIRKGTDMYHGACLLAYYKKHSTIKLPTNDNKI